MTLDRTVNSPLAQAGSGNISPVYVPVLVLVLLLIAIVAICSSPPPDVSQFSSSVVLP
jgi:hypothetical protein